MITPFLERIYSTYADADLSQYCFVFPTRRAGFVFREQFVKRKKVTWLPEILGIRDLIAKLHSVPVGDDLILLLKLYNILKEQGMKEELEHFLPWGKILLNDFNEIDQHLVNAKQLYRQTYEERQIDQAFALSPEEMQEIAGFWKLFATTPLSTLQENFLASWKLLPEVYEAFNGSLKREKLTYEGRAYKEVAESAVNKTLKLPWKKIVFCGFYALSHAEQVLLEELQNQGLADIYWDIDSFYFDNTAHEAGLYLRRNPLVDETVSWKGSYFKEQERDIYITGVPLQSGQVKWISNLLKDKLGNSEFNPEKSVIVLPDENMLPALLYSLPEELKNINVTMGYPAKNSIAASLINAYITLHKNAVKEKDQQFYLRLLMNELFEKISSKEQLPLFYKLLSADTHPLIRSSVIKVEAGKYSYLLDEITSSKQLKNILLKLIHTYNEQLQEQHAVERAVCNHMIEELNHFFDVLSTTGEKLTVKIIFNLIEEHLQTLKIPFAGEPLKGIQVMGFLETRTLDFENVFILSVNETLLPATSAGKTYLPYSIRKAYKLPLRTEQDAVYSYHFYRLLQRASQIHLIYNTEPRSLSGGEISRYLLQISMELGNNPDYPVTIHHEAVSTDALIKAIPPITVYKDDEVLQRLRKLYIEEGSGKGLSVTALSEYVHCTLRFYFKYVAKLKVPDEEKEQLDAAMFGQVFHKAISNIYEGKKTITKEDIKSLNAIVEPSLNEAILSEYKKQVNNGSDYLLKSVLKELLQRIVKNDHAESPLDIEGHELEYAGILPVENAGYIRVYGKIDRIDNKDGVLRVIDYKTGGDEVSDKYSLQQLFSDPKKKVMLQLLFYSWLIKQNRPEAVVKAGMYKLRNISQGIKWMEKGNIITNELLSVFETQLQSLIADLFNAEIPFFQTDDIKRCEYCDFINICGRNK